MMFKFETGVVRKLQWDEIYLLLDLFDYNDTEKMLADNIRCVQNETIDIFGLFQSNQLIGEIRIKYEDEDSMVAQKNVRAYIYAFRIAEKHQDKGYGSYLLNYIIEVLKSKGYFEITVGVEDTNLKARHIYEKYGFISAIKRVCETYQGDTYQYDLLLNKIQ